MTPIFVSSQNDLNSVIIALKDNNFKKAKLLSHGIENEKIKELFLSQIQYQIEGSKKQIDIKKTLHEPRNREGVIYNYLVADYYTILKGSKKDSLIFKSYLESYRTAVDLKDSLLISEILRKLNAHIIYRTRDTVSSRKFIDIYKRNIIDDIDKFWYYFFEVTYNYMLTENEINSVDHREMESFFNELLNYSKKQSFNRGQYHQLLGIYQSHWLQNYGDANNHNLKAKELYSKIPYWYAQSKLMGLEFNTAINYYKNGEPRKAIPFFIKDLNRDKEQVLIMYTNEWLYKCYENLKKYDSAHFYFKEMVNVKEQMDQKKHSRVIREIEGKYNIEEKEQELELMAVKNNSLQTQLLTILPILGLISLISIFTFFLYKRYRRKSNILEGEQSETLQKLDELKKIVIKNHIILKNKTKVYISELMYVKSDDHYLNIYLSDSKNHFVRGKLSQIKEELPPNFIQCHRSYIVNSNFIKQVNGDTLTLIDKTQIPLSRSYKDKF